MAIVNVVNPYNSEIILELACQPASEVKLAVASACEGFYEWSKTDLSERKEILLRYCKLLEIKQKELAREITVQMGKPIQQGITAPSEAAEDARWYVENAEKALSSEKIDEKSKLVWEPRGVVACIKPWNYPLELVSWCAVPALLFGNTVVLKHSEIVPLTGRSIAQLMHEAGVPENAFVLVEGDGETGAALVNSDIDMVSFTGSSEVGKEIACKCGQRMIKTVLELGGSSPAIVFEEANLGLAVDKIAASRFNNCGQVCSSAKRLIVQEPVAEQLVIMLREKIARLVMGDPLDEKTTLGPLASLSQRAMLGEQVEDAREKGGRVVEGGQRPDAIELEQGAFYEPTLILDTPRDSKVWRQETFGPVLAVRTFKTEDQAVALANDTDFGLTAQVYTTDKVRWERVSEKVQAGNVFLNGSWAGHGKYPWFGIKSSGWGFEGMIYGFREFAVPKHVFEC